MYWRGNKPLDETKRILD